MTRSAIAVLSVLLFTVPSLAQTTWYVDDDNCPGPGTGTMGDPFCSIQSAMIASANGDEIMVAEGIYNEVIKFAGKAVTVRSSDPLDPVVVAGTIIDGAGVNDSVISCTSGEGPGTVLAGVTIAGGMTGDTSGNGGGMVIDNNSSPTVRNCVFDGNVGADLGGGIFVGTGCSPTVENCTFNNNAAMNQGGAVYNFQTSPIQYVDCVFDSNSSFVTAGAMYNNQSTVTLIGCEFIGNTAISNGGAVNGFGSTLNLNGCTFSSNTSTSGGGGAIYSLSGLESLANCTFEFNSASTAGGAINSQNAATTYSNCQFVGNNSTSSWGGAIVAYDTPVPGVSMNGSTFDGNSASGNGGALAIELTDGTTLVDCTIRNNDASSLGGGVYCNGDSGTNQFTRCTFEGNSAMDGGGIYSAAVLQLSACTLVDNSASVDGGGVLILGNNALNSIENSVFSGNQAVTGNGGAVSHAAPGSIINCSFSQNVAGGLGGGVRQLFYAGTMANCVVWNNGPDEISVGSGALAVNYSNVLGGYAGTGNINADPLFVDDDGADDVVGTVDDDLRLSAASPCTDAGDASSVPSGLMTDRDGNPRFVDGDYDTLAQVDIGAYELNPEAVGQIVNLSMGLIYSSFGSAFAAAVDGDQLLASAQAFANDGNVDFNSKQVTLTSTGGIAQPAGGLYELSDGATLATATGDNLTVANELRIDSNDTADIEAAQFATAVDGRINVRSGAGLFISAPGGADLDGDTTLFGGAILGFTGDVSQDGGLTAISGATIDIDGHLTNTGLLQCADVDIVADSLVNEAGADFIGNGSIYAPITNSGDAIYTANMLAVGDYTNHDTTIVQTGTLTIIGSLINNGTIIGDVQTTPPFSGGGGATQPGDGMSILGDFIAGPSASLSLPDPVWRLTVSGNCDIAVNDNTLYHMTDAELRLSGGSDPQYLEIMSLDIGADSAGFDRTLPGHYPIGTLRIGPSLTTVNMVDVHDNDGLGQGVCEAIYTKKLIIESGGTLNTNGCIVYYESLQLNGIVDEPLNLMQMAPCPADTNGDATVDVVDLLAVLGAWGANPGHPADTNGDDVVDVTDLLFLLGSWGVCLG